MLHHIDKHLPGVTHTRIHEARRHGLHTRTSIIATSSTPGDMARRQYAVKTPAAIPTATPRLFVARCPFLPHYSLCDESNQEQPRRDTMPYRARVTSHGHTITLSVAQALIKVALGNAGKCAQTVFKSLHTR